MGDEKEREKRERESASMHLSFYKEGDICPDYSEHLPLIFHYKELGHMAAQLQISWEAMNLTLFLQPI